MFRPIGVFLFALNLPVGAQISWCPVEVGGFGNANNELAAAAVEYGGRLYVGTFNASGAELYCYDGSSFAPVVIPTFSGNNQGVLCGVIHQGELVLGTVNDATAGLPESPER